MAVIPSQINLGIITEFVNYLLSSKGFAPLSELELLSLSQGKSHELWALVMLNPEQAVFVSYVYSMNGQQLEAEWLSADLLSRSYVEEEWSYLHKVWGADSIQPAHILRTYRVF